MGGLVVERFISQLGACVMVFWMPHELQILLSCICCLWNDGHWRVYQRHRCEQWADSGSFADHYCMRLVNARVRVLWMPTCEQLLRNKMKMNKTDYEKPRESIIRVYEYDAQWQMKNDALCKRFSIFIFMILLNCLRWVRVCGRCEMRDATTCSTFSSLIFRSQHMTPAHVALVCAAPHMRSKQNLFFSKWIFLEKRLAESFTLNGL